MRFHESFRRAARVLALALVASFPSHLMAQYEKEKAAATQENLPLESLAEWQHQLFNFDWKFCYGSNQGAEAPGFDDSAWRSLDLPHDFQFEQPWSQKAGGARGFKEMGEGWYRKTFQADTLWRGRRVCLDFGGIIYLGDVYVNGHQVASTDYGYIGFETEISKYLRYDQPNVVAVWASTGPKDGSRWYTGGGLFRDVYLSVTNPSHIVRHGIFVSTPQVSEQKAIVALQVEAEGYKGHECELQARFYGPNGQLVGQSKAGFPSLTKHTRVEVEMPSIAVANPALWSPDSPSLYRVEVEMTADGQVVDRQSETFGIRWFEFSKDFGMKLNGKKTYLIGMANHHDMGALGAASYDRAIERQMLQMKAFGYNCIRCSHNPYSESFTRIADRVGLIVVDELIDKWSNHSYWGGRRDFTDIWDELIPEWIKRDRNSPSVCLWSLGNELQMREDLAGFQSVQDWGITTYRIFKVMVERFDPTRLTTVAMFPSRAGAIRNEKEFKTYLVAPELACVTDVASFNYQWPAYQGYLEHNPDLIVFQSEATTRELLGPFYGMDRDRMVGLAYWGAIEYWGESNGWPKKGWNYSYFSHTLQPYPQAWLMKSAFVPDEPVVRLAVADGSAHIEEWNDVMVGQQTYTSFWNHPEGSLQQVAVFSNADEVELFNNGQSLGRKANDNTQPGTQHIVTYKDVPYGQGGTLLAVGYRDGREVARHEISTAGKAVKLMVETETPSGWKADGMDLQYLNVFAVDAKGRRVPGFADEVKVSVSGEASLLALDNGDHYTDELFGGIDVKTMKDGYLQVILRSTRQAGKVLVRLESGSLKQTLKLQTN